MAPLLYLPAHYVPSSATAESQPEFLGVHIGRRELIGNPGNITELVQKLSQLNCEQVLGWATYIGTLFDYHHRHSNQEQLAIANQVLSEELLLKLKTRWQDSARQNEVMFHRQQLWMLIQFAVMCCTNDLYEKSNDDAAKRILGECLLIANDIVGDQLTRRFNEEKSTSSAEWFMSASFLSMFELNWQATGPVCTTRAIHIWTGLLAEDRNQKAIDRLLKGYHPDQAFYDTYGVSLNRYIDFVASLHYVFHDQNEKKNPLRIDRTVLSNLGDDEFIDRCLKLLSRTPEQLAADLIFRPRQSWAVDFSPIRQYPVIRLAGDRFVCPDIQLLEYYFDDALYWSIVEAYTQAGEIQQFYGELFEQHINDVIKTFSVHSSVLATPFLPGPKFDGDNAQVSDAVLDWPQSLAVIEYKATRLTRYQKYSGDSSALLKGIDDAYAKKKGGDAKGVTQLARSANRILTGDRISGASPLGSRPILPVLLISETGITNEFVRRRLDDALQRQIEPDHRPRVMPLVLLSHFDMEALETYLGVSSAEDLLRSYSNSLRAKNANLLDTFSAHTYRKHRNVVPSGLIYMQKLLVEQHSAIAARLGIPKESRE